MEDGVDKDSVQAATAASLLTPFPVGEVTQASV